MKKILLTLSLVTMLFPVLAFGNCAACHQNKEVEKKNTLQQTTPNDPYQHVSRKDIISISSPSCNNCYKKKKELNIYDSRLTCLQVIEFKVDDFSTSPDYVFTAPMKYHMCWNTAMMKNQTLNGRYRQIYKRFPDYRPVCFELHPELTKQNIKLLVMISNKNPEIGIRFRTAIADERGIHSFLTCNPNADTGQST